MFKGSNRLCKVVKLTTQSQMNPKEFVHNSSYLWFNSANEGSLEITWGVPLKTHEDAFFFLIY